eukprot:gb/GEZN01000280.1/.p1 GENE.gb/GEZN01000280.1/~~gb/GEZN01000280.1/.p1  ORF type:complete len:1722 (-),score=262.54 gb/GEZN01000280.1/:13-5178(-)
MASTALEAALQAAWGKDGVYGGEAFDSLLVSSLASYDSKELDLSNLRNFLGSYAGLVPGVALALSRNQWVDTLLLGCDFLESGGDLAALMDGLKQNTSLRRLYAPANKSAWGNYFKAGPDEAKYVADFLHTNRTLSLLAFDSHDFGDLGTELVAAALSAHPALIILSLKNNGITAVGTEALARSVSAHPTITSLDLRDDQLSQEAVQVLCKAPRLVNLNNLPLEMLRNGKIISLQNLELGSQGAVVIGECLKLNKLVVELSLHRNGLKAEDAKYITEALKINTSLQVLRVSEHIGPEGLQHIMQLLHDNKTLTTLSICSSTVGPGANHIAAMLKVNTTLHLLDLSQCDLADAGATAVADGLSFNSSVRELSLVGNSIGAEGMVQIARSLKDNKDCKISKLDLSTNAIGGAGGKGVLALAEAFKLNKSLANINLLNNQNLTDESAGVLAEGLKENKHIREIRVSFAWDSNGWGRGANQFAEMLKTNQSLQVLTFTNNMTVAGACAFADALKVNHTLRELEIGYNIGASGATHLAEALKVNHGLLSLKINGGSIGDEGGIQFAEALRVNKTLQVLDLYNNEVGPSGARALAEAFHVNTSVRTLVLSQQALGPEAALLFGAALKVNTALENLMLRDTQISIGGLQAIFQGLTENKTLLTLDVDQCGLNYGFDLPLAKVFVKFLLTNKSVQSIATTFSREYAQYILDALKKNANRSFPIMAGILKPLWAVDALQLPALAGVDMDNGQDDLFKLRKRHEALATAASTLLIDREKLRQIQSLPLQAVSAVELLSTPRITVNDVFLSFSDAPSWMSTLHSLLEAGVIPQNIFEYLFVTARPHMEPAATLSFLKATVMGLKTRPVPAMARYVSPLHFFASLEAKDVEKDWCDLDLIAVCQSFEPLLLDSKRTGLDPVDARGASSLQALRGSLYDPIRSWADSVGTYLGRYQRDPLPTYESQTCQLWFAKDIKAEESSGSAARVALKIMRPELPGARDSFHREVESRQSLAGLEKEVVMLIRTHAEECCIVMPAGEFSLADYIRRRNIAGRDIAEVQNILRRLAHCLQGLHGKGMVHGDMKPNNVVWVDGEWRVIDFDAAAKIGDRVGVKYSTSYCEPQLAAVVARSPDTQNPAVQDQLPIAEPAFDVFSLGVLLFELCTGEHIFPHITDNTAEVADLQRFCVWIGIADSQLEKVFQLASAQAKKDPQFMQRCRDAMHLTRWLLLPERAERPTLAQVLNHRFLDPEHGQPPPQPEVWSDSILRTTTVRERLHFFISHVQAEASGDVGNLSLELRRRGVSVWRDMDAKDLTEQGMRQGVADSAAFILLLTNSVLSRPYCLKEMLWALEFGKPFIIVVETDLRLFPFDWERWSRNLLDKLPGWNQWGISTSLGSTYENCVQHFRRVHDEVKRQLEQKECIPLRRRNFETDAMVREVFLRAANRGCLWSHRLTPKPLVRPRLSQQTSGSTLVQSGGVTQQGAAAPTVNHSALPEDQARWPRVFVICSTEGKEMALDLAEAFHVRYPDLAMLMSTDSKAIPQGLVEAECVMVLLTAGVLAVGAPAMSQLRYATQHAKPLFIIYNENAGWRFGGAESQAAPHWVMERITAHEFMTYRSKSPLLFEFLAMCDELVSRLVSPTKPYAALSDGQVSALDEKELANWQAEQQKAVAMSTADAAVVAQAGADTSVETRMRQLEAELAAEKARSETLAAEKREMAAEMERWKKQRKKALVA